MSILGLIARACRNLGIREPMEFYALSVGAQDFWLADALADFTGAYVRQPPPRPGEDPKAAAKAARVAEWVAAARARGVLTDAGYDPTRRTACP